MKYTLTNRLILLPLVTILFSFCCSKKPHNGTDSKIDVTAESTGSSQCDYGIDLFNKQAAGNVIKDINLVYSKNNAIPDDLKKVYPAARDTWNRLLKEVQHNYTNSYTVTSLDKLTSEEIRDWRNKNLKDDQVFFLLLAEYRYGAYPYQTNDMEKKAGWIEKADPKKRLEAYISNAITGNCYSLSSEKIRKKLSPILLPDNIEDCYR